MTASRKGNKEEKKVDGGKRRARRKKENREGRGDENVKDEERGEVERRGGY